MVVVWLENVDSIKRKKQKQKSRTTTNCKFLFFSFLSISPFAHVSCARIETVIFTTTNYAYTLHWLASVFVVVLQCTMDWVHMCAMCVYFYGQGYLAHFFLLSLCLFTLFVVHFFSFRFAVEHKRNITDNLSITTHLRRSCSSAAPSTHSLVSGSHIGSTSYFIYPIFATQCAMCVIVCRHCYGCVSRIHIITDRVINIELNVYVSALLKRRQRQPTTWYLNVWLIRLRFTCGLCMPDNTTFRTFSLSSINYR